MAKTQDEWEDEPQPEIEDKRSYLRLVNVEDCIKDLVTGLYSLRLQHSIANRLAKQKKTVKPLMKNRANPTKEQQKLVDKLEDVNEQRWSTGWETESSEGTGEDGDLISVPSHYKKYTVEDQKIMVKQLERLKVTQGISYDGPEDTKKIDLAKPGEDPKIMYIATDLDPEEEQKLIDLLQEYRDVFAWSFKDLKGVDSAIC